MNKSAKIGVQKRKKQRSKAQKTAVKSAKIGGQKRKNRRSKAKKSVVKISKKSAQKRKTKRYLTPCALLHEPRAYLYAPLKKNAHPPKKTLTTRSKFYNITHDNATLSHETTTKTTMKITSYPTFIDLCAFLATINADTPVLFATNADYNDAPNEYYAMNETDALDALAHLTLAFPSLDSLDYSTPTSRFNANDFVRRVYSDSQYTPLIKIDCALYAISDFVDDVVPTLIITPCTHPRTPNI